MGTCSSKDSSAAVPPQPVKPKQKSSNSGSSSSRPQAGSASSSKAKLPSFNDSKSGDKFHTYYKLGPVIGAGAFSTVREGLYKPSNSRNANYAIKIVSKTKLTKEDTDALFDEVEILKAMKHPNIIRLYDFFEEHNLYYLVMEKMSGGELFDRIVTRSYYNEKDARDLCKILLEAMVHIHESQIAHRDLKPENLLLVSGDDDSIVKIADFGFAKRCPAGKKLKTQCGTPGYVAPEILMGVPYGTKADMWSIGVILYILLGGYPPFIENNQRDLFRKIKAGEYEFHKDYWDGVSKEAKVLISSLLTVDPRRRLSARDALKNSWISQGDDTLAIKDLGVNLVEFRKFNAKRKLRAAVRAITISNRFERRMGYQSGSGGGL
uniref:non-specific serine/threonine protein kinase n=1 Tax=Leptocylindrus danicus TaxID=163516 RepID=A0A7S2LQ71_9STRA|mmetsp:Transcript_8635/g.12797  ORF Transcript_8635/g.12797 Transcript_8635/m.12797 type:complete len:378 (+) Transcript_8635:129-1262(+)|eukprot:CAMPEP_0116025170 /NCGR_PEP_ID=MMETSP0321-20121206/12862_1 /TAXON_ID=163516 /ORGANISM="Leptocylindrus danicus var. danicus, Strain B650" /LENGTH=377 /DNA_ID=CAMNT_0003497259 /DNA_START=129 /DNA_END=1262 /DNA_ORIENTATION=+